MASNCPVGQVVIPRRCRHTRNHVLRCDYSVLLLPNATGGNVEERATDAHTISVAGVWCVTLGHGITSSVPGYKDVRAHAFLGDYYKVLRNLSSLNGFLRADGVVHCAGTRRGGADGQICGFVGENVVMMEKQRLEKAARVAERV